MDPWGRLFAVAAANNALAMLDHQLLMNHITADALALVGIAEFDDEHIILDHIEELVEILGTVRMIVKLIDKLRLGKSQLKTRAEYMR